MFPAETRSMLDHGTTPPRQDTPPTPPERKSRWSARTQVRDSGAALLPALLLQDPLLVSRNLFHPFLSVWEELLPRHCSGCKRASSSEEHSEELGRKAAVQKTIGITTPIQTWRAILLGGLGGENIAQKELSMGGTVQPKRPRGVSVKPPFVPEVEVRPRPSSQRSGPPPTTNPPFWDLNTTLQSCQSQPWALQDLSDEQRSFLPLEPMDMSTIRKVVAIDAE